MLHALRSTLVVVLLGCASVVWSQPKSSPIVITNVTVIDVIDGAARPAMTVLVRGDRIDRVATNVDIPLEARRIDGSGKFLIPGLWDMHSHHQATGADWVDLFVAKGVVGMRDMGADADFRVGRCGQARGSRVAGREPPRGHPQRGTYQ